ncbi:hypothetical protein [Roseomonas rosulenta]|uniref:hypothetical protein n=1 Tax=Roseomonas rosulenta TaxID=2748667 RepID=UPI0018E01BEF|nr:hypothetical protein [Roseomonas rosulenta]
MPDAAVPPEPAPAPIAPPSGPAWLRDDLAPAAWQDTLLADIVEGLHEVGQSLAALRLLVSPLSPRVRAAARLTDEGAARLPAALDAALHELETIGREHLGAEQQTPPAATSAAVLHAAQAALCLLQQLSPTPCRGRLLAARTAAVQAQLRNGERSAAALGLACAASADAALAAWLSRWRLQTLLGLDRGLVPGMTDAPPPPGAPDSPWRDPTPYRTRGAGLPAARDSSAPRHAA